MCQNRSFVSNFYVYFRERSVFHQAKPNCSAFLPEMTQIKDGVETFLAFLEKNMVA